MRRFIHELCERIREVEASALWRPALQRRAKHQIYFVTTNYDRALEIACRRLDINYDDGFADFAGREFAEWTGISNESRLMILKIHGSHRLVPRRRGEVYKLRHPIPLYGELSLANKGGGMPRLTSAMVLPTREKRVNQPPYPDLVADLETRHAAQTWLCFLGTSLRDPDISDIFRQCRKRHPYIYRRTWRPEPWLGRDRRGQGNSAETSEFAISTLPLFLHEAETGYLDEMAREMKRESQSVLPWSLQRRKGISRRRKFVMRSKHSPNVTYHWISSF